MRARQKATGWKVPLLFCGAMLVLVALGALLRTPAPAPPELPQALVDKARALVIDLDTSGGRPWKERIVSAASGFTASEARAGRLAAVAAEATAAGRLDAALAAAVQIQDDARRDAALEGIFRAARASCASLPWAVFAVHGVRGRQLAEGLAGELEARWRACGGENGHAAPAAPEP